MELFFNIKRSPIIYIAAIKNNIFKARQILQNGLPVQKLVGYASRAGLYESPSASKSSVFVILGIYGIEKDRNQALCNQVKIGLFGTL